MARWYKINETCFNSITSDSAYWIGFLMADGCVFKNQVSIGLSVKDFNHLEKFCKFVETDMPIRKPNNSCVIRISSNQICQKLETFGVIPRKSKIAKVNQLEFNKDFWRGVIDGDGCLSVARNVACISLVGSKGITQQFLNFVKSFGDTKTTIKKHPKSETTYTISVSGYLAEKIISILYKDSKTSLSRKYETACKIFELYQQKQNQKDRRSELSKEVVKLYSKGLSSLKIQEILSIGKSTALSYLAKEGVARRYERNGLTTSQRYRLKGKCKDCGKDVSPNSKSRCEYHLEKNRNYWRKTHQKNI